MPSFILGRRQPSPRFALTNALVLAAALFAQAHAADAHVTFSVTFDASASALTSTERADIVSHVQEAGRRWATVVGVAAPRSIEVLVLVDTIPTANGASATTQFIGQIGGRDTYEQGAAYELRTGIDPNGADPDARITFGLDYLRNELWFDPDPTARTAPVPNNRTDAMSTILHEFGHVLAYNGWADLDTGVPTPAYWSIWDSWMVPGSAPVFAGPAAMAAWFDSAPALTIGNINHWGNAANGAGGEMAELCDRGPTQWRNGAPRPRVCSVPRSEDAPRKAPFAADGTGDLIAQLMNGVVFYRGTRYDISPLDRGVLQDVGLLADVVFADGFDG